MRLVEGPLSWWPPKLMHELTVTQNILNIALHHAEGCQASHIEAINLVIGQMASIVDDCVQFYWDTISKDTIAQGSVLRFERIPARLTCETCHCTYLLNESGLTSPHCGGSALTIIGGDEFYIASIEVEA
jgi:hydrogenase nickel incorporation protein HypA/HybF